MDARYIVLLRIQSTLILNRLTISTRTAAAGAGSALSVVDPDCGACSNDEDDLSATGASRARPAWWTRSSATGSGPPLLTSSSSPLLSSFSSSAVVLCLY